MQLQHGARTESKVVPLASLVKPFANKVLAVEIKAGDVTHLPPAPVIRDYLKRERDKKRPGMGNQLPCYIDDDLPSGWTPQQPEQKAPDAERGVFEIQF